MIYFFASTACIPVAEPGHKSLSSTGGELTQLSLTDISYGNLNEKQNLMFQRFRAFHAYEQKYDNANA